VIAAKYAMAFLMVPTNWSITGPHGWWQRHGRLPARRSGLELSRANAAMYFLPWTPPEHGVEDDRSRRPVFYKLSLNLKRGFSLQSCKLENSPACIWTKPKFQPSIVPGDAPVHVGAEVQANMAGSEDHQFTERTRSPHQVSCGASNDLVHEESCSLWRRQTSLGMICRETFRLNTVTPRTPGVPTNTIWTQHNVVQTSRASASGRQYSGTHHEAGDEAAKPAGPATSEQACLRDSSASTKRGKTAKAYEKGTGRGARYISLEVHDITYLPINSQPIKAPSLTSLLSLYIGSYYINFSVHTYYRYMSVTFSGASEEELSQRDKPMLHVRDGRHRDQND
jgi:hypothetical protein